MKSSTSKGGSKGRKPPDTRPARKRYWDSGRMAIRKLRRLISSGYSVLGAIEEWDARRKRFKGAFDPLRATIRHQLEREQEFKKKKK